MADDNRIGQFLRARRERVRPEDVGLPDLGRRRVPGLRREELATLAGVSADYYVRLDDDATAHLHDLARPAPRRRRASKRTERVRPELLRLMEAWAHTPALVTGRHVDVLAANSLATALHGGFARGNNLVRTLFLDPAARERYPDWDEVARDTVAALRASVGPDLDDPHLTDLVGELSLTSEQFRALWARHDVREKTHGTKRFVHPQVGELTLHYETFAVAGSSGQVLSVYNAEPGSPTEQALALLSSIAATGNASAAAPAASG